MASLPYPRCPILWILWILWENSAPQPSVSIRAIRGRKDIPAERTERTEPSGREEPPTDDTDVHRLGGYGIPAIPTLPNSVFCEFCGRTAHHNYLCQSVPSVGVLSLQEGSVRSVPSVGGVAVVWCSRDCCTPWWCIRAICGRFSQQSASVSSACSVGGQRSSNLL